MCSLDIRLDWQSFIVEDDDTQLLDLHVMIGNPFPLLDEDNREVESDEDVPDPLVRVRLSLHEGVQCTLPFKMEPKQLVRTVFFIVGFLPCVEVLSTHFQLTAASLF